MGPAVEAVQWASFLWNDQPHEEVNQKARHTARNEGDQERQAKPESADAKEIAQTAAYPGNDPVVPGTAQRFSCFSHHFISFEQFHLSSYLSTQKGS